jgi:hypothetical protein
VTTDSLVCWKCGASLEDTPLPFGRSAECKSCGAELHACRMCELYDPRVSQSCREPAAEEVVEKERSNFCEYFQARPGAYLPSDDAAARAARAELQALFGARDSGLGQDKASAETAQREAEKLFGPPGKR